VKTLIWTGVVVCAAVAAVGLGLCRRFAPAARTADAAEADAPVAAQPADTRPVDAKAARAADAPDEKPDRAVQHDGEYVFEPFGGAVFHFVPFLWLTVKGPPRRGVFIAAVGLKA